MGTTSVRGGIRLCTRTHATTIVGVRRGEVGREVFSRCNTVTLTPATLSYTPLPHPASTTAPPTNTTGTIYLSPCPGWFRPVLPRSPSRSARTSRAGPAVSSMAPPRFRADDMLLENHKLQSHVVSLHVV